MLEKSRYVTNCWLSVIESLTIVHPDFSSGCVLDAQGNQMNTYEHTVSTENASYAIVERNIYGSSRLGMDITKAELLSESTSTHTEVVLGNKLYELTNHLGNFDDTWFLRNKNLSGMNPVRYDTGVLTIIKDVKIPIADDNYELVDHYDVTMHLVTDYSPFGVELDGRTIEKKHIKVLLDAKFNSTVEGFTPSSNTNISVNNQKLFVRKAGNGQAIIGTEKTIVLEEDCVDCIVKFEFTKNFGNNPVICSLGSLSLGTVNSNNTYTFHIPFLEAGEHTLKFVTTTPVNGTSNPNANPNAVRSFTLDNISIICEKGGKYRYGFQNQEKDDEVKGEGNSVNFKYRMHDPRLGRFFAVDPLAPKYPHNSPYAFSENVVINAIELEGLEKFYSYTGVLLFTYGNSSQKRVITDYDVVKGHYKKGNLNNKYSPEVAKDLWNASTEAKKYDASEVYHNLGVTACKAGALMYFDKYKVESKKGNKDLALAYYTASKLLGDFATGTGEDHQDFDQNHPFTMLLNKNNQLIKEAVKDFEKELKETGMSAPEYFQNNSSFPGNYEFSPDHGGAQASLIRHLNAISNPVDFVIGGMKYNMIPMYDDQQKLAGYVIKFENTTGKNSLMLHQATDVPQGSGKTLANKTQTFTIGISLDQYEDVKNNK